MMKTVTLRGKTYRICKEGFLVDPGQWDADFAEAMAPTVRIAGGLTDKHWAVVNYIRETYKDTGTCPLVYETCDANELYLKDLQRLFPTGYQRGACKLAGITFKEGYQTRGSNRRSGTGKSATDTPEKIYHVNVRGFLVDPDEWDEEFAAAKAAEMKIPGNLTDRHWQILRFVRDSYFVNHTAPTVYETCQANALDLEELERLFPDGYHQGVVKLAGLRI